jgi:nitrogen fixation protein NifU and related proteins
MSDLHALYHPLIRQHHAQPYHFQQLPDAPVTIRAYNPVCGDRFDFYPEVKAGMIISIHFHGYGCAVSVAAGSVLCETLEGKSIPEAIALCERYLASLKQDVDVQVPEAWQAFRAVRQFPSRYDCAALAWIDMLKHLNDWLQVK